MKKSSLLLGIINYQTRQCYQPLNFLRLYTSFSYLIKYLITYLKFSNEIDNNTIIPDLVEYDVFAVQVGTEVVYLHGWSHFLEDAPTSRCKTRSSQHSHHRWYSAIWKAQSTKLKYDTILTTITHCKVTILTIRRQSFPWWTVNTQPSTDHHLLCVSACMRVSTSVSVNECVSVHSLSGSL